MYSRFSRIQNWKIGLYPSAGFIIFLCLFFVQTAHAQLANVVTVCNLPDVISESSGLEITGANRYWSHNDSGGDPALYAFDSSGTLLTTLLIENATNVDWEDLARGGGKMYIGDFGNNSNDRSIANGNPLCIYIIDDPGETLPTQTSSEALIFEYSNRDFNAPSNNHNFDMEAFFWWNDSLHLFSKNRTNPSTGWIYHYVLPAQSGTFTAMLVDSLNDDGIRITGADITEDGLHVVLEAENHLYFLRDYQWPNILQTATILNIPMVTTQKEGIAFENYHRLWMSDERNGNIGQKLYRLSIDTYTGLQNIEKPAHEELFVFRTSERRLINKSSHRIEYAVHNSEGKLLAEGKIEPLEQKELPQNLYGMIVIKAFDASRTNVQCNQFILPNE